MHRPVPDSLTTERLLIRRWRREDAAALGGALEHSVEELRRWIPPAVAEPASPAELEARIARYEEKFEAGMEWRYAILTRDGAQLIGGLSLHPRTEHARVAISAADRIEIGYWLRSDATGRGYATEAARAGAEVALRVPGITLVEIRCDPRNAPSVAVPRRLGFVHAKTIAGGGGELSLWTQDGLAAR